MDNYPDTGGDSLLLNVQHGLLSVCEGSETIVDGRVIAPVIDEDVHQVGQAASSFRDAEAHVEEGWSQRGIRAINDASFPR